MFLTLLWWRVYIIFSFWKIPFQLHDILTLCFGVCLRVCYITCHACLRANMVYVPTCLRNGVVYVSTCQCANKRANVPVFQLDVPTCHMLWQFFKHSSYEMLRDVSILYYYIKKFYIILGIIVIHIICICIVHKNCIIFHFYTSCHIKEKCVEFLFLLFFCFLLVS